MLARDGLHGSLRVRHVRLRGAADAVRARQRFESAVSVVDASSLGLPSHAVLIVRRLAPGAPLPLERVHHSTAFQRAVSVELIRCAQSARRPWVHADAVAADGVWFADDTELVACLVRDWLRGAVHDCWWWPAVLSGVAVTTWLKAHVLHRGDLLAPALSQVATAGAAAGWVARLNDSDAAQGLEAVQRAYGVPRASPRAMTELRRGASDAASVDSAPHQNVAGRDDEPARLGTQLLAIVPELQHDGLRATQARLLVAALVAIRAPAWLRTESFATTVERWIAASSTRQRMRSLAAPTSIALPRPVSRDEDGDLTTRDAPVTLLPSPSRATAKVRRAVAITSAGAEATVGSTPDSAARGMHPRSRRTSSIVASRPAPQHDAVGNESGVATASPAEHTSRAPDVATRPHVADTLGAVAEVAGIVVDTQFGGIFYLLNAAIALELYGDFTMPRSPGIALSPWDLLALAGRAWFGEAFVRDPLWNVLASLAGRASDDEPGQHFVAPRSWQVDASWLAPWGSNASLRVHATRTRLRVMHEAGFPILDVGAARPRTRTKRWINALITYLQARLARALGTYNPIAVRSLACRHEARVVVTTTAVDVHLTLAHLPLPIRFAGLDRDPGWIPAAGRSVAFHFA